MIFPCGPPEFQMKHIAGARQGGIKMQRRFWKIAAFAVLILQGPRQISGAEARPDAAIEKTTESYRKAVLAGDAAAVGATYSRDAVEMPPCRPPLKGRDAIERYYRDMFGGPMKIAAFSFTRLETAAAGNIGFAIGGYQRTLIPNGGESVEDSGSFAVIVKREGGTWKAAYVIYNSDRAPAAQAGIVAALAIPIPAVRDFYTSAASRWLAWLAAGSIAFGAVAWTSLGFRRRSRA